MITRKEYMDGRLNLEGSTIEQVRAFNRNKFLEYYGQFSSPNVVEYVATYIGKEKLLASTDEHLNDIPMRIWDDAPWFGMQRAVAEANGRHSNGKIYTSLSDKVCAVKCAAHKWIEENRK